MPRSSSPSSSSPSPSSSLLVEPIPHAILLGRGGASLTELARLVHGLGIRAARTVVHKRGITDLGKGKQDELAALLRDVRSETGDPAPLLIVDGELRPGQQRLLERALGCEIVDRTGVILRVFTKRAQTRTARLEVEAARLAYEAPRVRDTAAINDRGGGGGGRGERGHTGVELRKQRLRARLASVTRDLVLARGQHETERDRRSDLPAVALVGYTNAGKSSLMRALTGSEVFIEDELFATLTTTVRALHPPIGPRVLVTDTIGFIKDLPHQLVASFRSTLDEARAADLLLLVVDAADPEWAEQLQVTRTTLAAIGADLPSLIVFNKIDRADDDRRRAIAAAWPEALQLSAHDPADVTRLHAALADFFDARLIDDVLQVAPDSGRLYGEIRTSTRVCSEAVAEDDPSAQLWLRVRSTPAALARLRKATGQIDEVATAADLVQLARRHGLAVSAPDADFERSGLDFLVVHAHDQDGVAYVLRTPRRPEVFAGARIEARALRLVSPRLPVEVPAWLVHARALISYRRLGGTPAVTLGATGPTWNHVDPQAPGEVFLDSYAAALAALQQIPVAAVINAGLPQRPIAEARAILARTMDEVRAALAPPDALWARWQRWIGDDDSWPRHLALVHGDLHPGHLLLAPDGRLTGILDWTEAALADPSIDLALFHGAFGAAGLAALLPRLERAGVKLWPRLAQHAAERWAAFPVVVAEWALRTGNDAALAHARALLAGVS